MGLFKIWQESRGIMRLLIIQLICWLGWFSTFALAQLDMSEGVTGFVTFPALGVTCVGNLAVFVTSLIRGRLDLEMGARDVLDILMSPQLFNITGIENGNGLTTYTMHYQSIVDADVVMLSNGIHNWSINRYFVKSNANFVKIHLLQILPWEECKGVTVEACKRDKRSQHSCNCITFWTVDEITNMFDRRMRQTLKRLSESLCLLPCGNCLINGCYGCNQEGPFHVDTSLPLVSQILDNMSRARISIRAGEPISICIPMKDASRDDWTKLLVRFFRSKDAEGRGVTVKASEALEGYLAGGRGGVEGSVEYNISSLIVPRFTEIIINFGLTFWFRVDGFSSALVARRTVRDYLVDTKGTGLAANAFLTKAEVKSDDNNTQVCQVLRFRGGNLQCIIALISTGFVNLICSLGWAVLISFERGADTSPPPTMPRVLLIITAIATAFGMDAAVLIMDTPYGSCILPVALILVFGVLSAVTLRLVLLWAKCRPNLIMVSSAPILESVYIVAGSAVAGTLGIKRFGRWVYAALQLLIWVKWACGGIFLNPEISEEFFGRRLESRVNLIYSSAFLLNAVLAGVRCTWEPWPWKDNDLFSRNTTSVHNHSVAA